MGKALFLLVAPLLLICLSSSAGTSDLPGLHRAYQYDSDGDRVLYGGVHYGIATRDRSKEGVLFSRSLEIGARGAKLFELESGMIRAFRPSSDGSHIAVLTADDQRGTNIQLRVLAADGSPIAAIPGVWDFSWSPTGDRLAIVMEHEADRMTGLKLTDDVVLSEREVVREVLSTGFATR